MSDPKREPDKTERNWSRTPEREEDKPQADTPTLAPSASTTGGQTGPTSRWFGDYELLEEIARGAMGVVYKARQKSLNRVVAIKMILAGRLAHEEDIQRFHAEAEAAANLDHPGIVPIYEVGHEEQQHFFSMGLVEGQCLADKTKDGPLTAREAATLVQKIATAVSYAHQHGVIHRDLKPSNIMLDVDGQPKIMDFGLAKRVEANNDLTATGQVLGTPSYMPPEQAEGKTNQVGRASDVYATGAILYELLTGRPPFQAATSLDTLMQVLHTDPVPPRLLNPTIPRDVETICLKCLEKDPKLRYGSAPELADDIRRFLDGDPIQATTVNLLGRVTRALAHSQRDEHFEGWGSALIGCGIIVLLAHVSIFLLQRAEFGPLLGYWIPRTVMFAVLGLLLWICRPQSVLPTNAAERPVWAVWIGYFLGLGATNVVIGLRGDNHQDLYVFSSILSGMCFFVMGSHVWGGSYLIGLAFLAAAPLLSLFPEMSPLWFGTLWGCALFVLGVHYRGLRRRR